VLLEQSPLNSKGRASGEPKVGGLGCGESGQGLGVIIGFLGFKEVMCVIRVSSFCWVFTSWACNLERACSRDTRHSFSMASKGAVPGNCFLKLSLRRSLFLENTWSATSQYQKYWELRM
jgi:hypothetical protein